MIQGTIVRVQSGNQNALIWPIINDQSISNANAVTRCVMVCKKDGEHDVVIDSDEVDGFDFSVTTIVRGVAVPAMQWIPGVAASGLFSANGLWRALVYLYDGAHANGVFHGEFQLRIPGITPPGPPVLSGELYSISDTEFIFNAALQTGYNDRGIITENDAFSTTGEIVQRCEVNGYEVILATWNNDSLYGRYQEFGIAFRDYNNATPPDNFSTVSVYLGETLLGTYANTEFELVGDMTSNLTTLASGGPAGTNLYIRPGTAEELFNTSGTYRLVFS